MIKYISFPATFLAGGVCFMNVIRIMYGVPQHYDASWWKVFGAIAVMLGCWLVDRRGY